jgi:hypothetical protein
MFRTAGALVAPVLLLVGLPAVPAQAAVHTSTGIRCTIVGTPGYDVLFGTSNRDVICGRGGYDVIYGRAGNDLIDPGSGGSWVVAGAGDDRVLAGTALNQVFGGRGNDRLSGGPGRDDLHGGKGNDRLSGNDGGDFLYGGTGADTLVGGAGDDGLRGGRSRDRLFGESGDDLLSGGKGADTVDGGTGENICAVDRGDASVRCYFDQDKAPPVVVETRISPTSVDVTDAPARVTVMVHATDDTGLYLVQDILRSADDKVQFLSSTEGQVSGNHHDAWWRSTFVVGRGTRAGVLYPLVLVTDDARRLLRVEATPVTVTVTDANLDAEDPRLALLAPLGTAPVDVRSAPADVMVSVHGTDDLSGVGRLGLCLSRPGDPDYVGVVCRDAVARSSGTDVDGIWTTVLQIPQGSVGGDWNVTAYVEDQAGSSNASWLGPDAYQQFVDHHGASSHIVPFPDGAGRLTVIGTGTPIQP